MSKTIMSAAELGACKVEDYGRNFILSDDGYDDMRIAERQGWDVLASWGSDGWNLGDWPYVAMYTRVMGGAFQLMQIVEGDHTVYTFASREERERALNYLFLWYAAGREWAPLTWEDRAKLDAGTLEVDPKFTGPYRMR